MFMYDHVQTPLNWIVQKHENEIFILKSSITGVVSKRRRLATILFLSQKNLTQSKFRHVGIIFAWIRECGDRLDGGQTGPADRGTALPWSEPAWPAGWLLAVCLSWCARWREFSDFALGGVLNEPPEKREGESPRFHIRKSFKTQHRKWCI